MLNFVNTNKITKKDQLPNIRRSSSLNSKNEQKIRLIEEKMILICDERPPLPKKPLRAWSIHMLFHDQSIDQYYVHSFFPPFLFRVRYSHLKAQRATSICTLLSFICLSRAYFSVTQLTPICASCYFWPLARMMSPYWYNLLICLKTALMPTRLRF